MTRGIPRSRDGAHRLEVEHVDGGVAEGLTVEELRAPGERAGEVLGVVRVHEHRVDAHAPERHVEQRAGAAVEGARGHDLVARFEEGEQGGGLRRLSARGGEGRPPVLERRHPLFEDGGGGVHEPGVDVPERLEVEQARGVVRVVEHVRGGLIDRHRPRAGRRVGDLSRVQAQGLDAVVAIRHASSVLDSPAPGAPEGPARDETSFLPPGAAGAGSQPPPMRRTAASVRRRLHAAGAASFVKRSEQPEGRLRVGGTGPGTGGPAITFLGFRLRSRAARVPCGAAQ